MLPRELEYPKFKALYGLGCITISNLIREGKFANGKTGIVPLNDKKFAERQRKIDK